MPTFARATQRPQPAVSEKKCIGSIGGSCRPDRDFPMFLRWFKEGDLDLDALVPARYSLDQITDTRRAPGWKDRPKGDLEF